MSWPTARQNCDQHAAALLTCHTAVATGVDPAGALGFASPTTAPAAAERAATGASKNDSGSAGAACGQATHLSSPP